MIKTVINNIEFCWIIKNIREEFTPAIGDTIAIAWNSSIDDL